ncbi:MAG: aldehyde ferredoxin oxidoreductase family protein, partial [Bacillota bacterium]
MGKGYCGRILHVDLSRKEFSVEEPEEDFYRKYLGGSCLASYYLNKQLPGGIDPLGPENILIFATSPTTGAPISGSSRFNITAKSPLTGAIGDSQGGGYWGPELKFAGFDALVIKGKASRPVYLYIKDGEYSLRDATSIWGQKLKEAEQRIKQELGDEKIRVALIGPGGENLVRYACIANELSHFNGRTGMGAVMGSKNLKAVAVRGTQSCQFADEDKIKDMARMGAKSIKDNPLVSSLQEYGTAGGIDVSQGIGGLPTHNYSSGVFAQAEEINGEKMLEELLEKRGTCRSCAVRCKRILKPGGPYDLDPAYGGPEFETLCSLGSNLEIDDLAAVCKANELCNSYGMDTISLGGTIAFALECYEEGLIDSTDTEGLELEFGNVDI